MSVQVVKRAPQTRCYKCGTTQVMNICHHCGRAMCATHSLQVTDSTGKLLSIEFVELGLKDTKCGEGPMHCEHCAHIVQVPSAGLIVAGVLIALAGLVILTRNLVPGFIGVLIGGGLAVYSYNTNQQRAAEAARSRPPLPLLPRFDPVHVRETLRGHITLDPGGHYHVSASPMEGALTIAASFAKPERDQLQQYRKKYQLADNEDVSFHAGFAVLRGPASLKFSDENANGNHSGTVIPLTGQVSTQPFLSGAGGRGSGEWRTTRRYGLLEASDPASLPIRLVPSLVPEAAQRALDLELQWTELDPTEAKLTIDRIESLELHVPIAWGEVESVTDSALIGTATSTGEGDGAVQTITWRRLSITDRGRQEHRRTFFVRFENITDPASTIRGRVEVTFKGTLSRLESVDLYYPLGGRREEEPANIETHVLADFELSLAGLRYQDVRVVPDLKEEKDRGKQETVTFEGIIPDHTTVMALTNAMSDQGFYVKRVIENPPRTGERANVVNRYWDIAGRRYLGVYPIDYHLILTGEEVYSGEIRAQAGTTKTTLTVQGVYANPDMEAQIENVWEQLTNLIGETLQQLPRAMPAAAQVVAQPQPVQPPVVPTEAAIGGDRAERVTILRKRLDQLMEALIAGRLSEKTYLELKAGIEQELQAPQAGA